MKINNKKKNLLLIKVFTWVLIPFVLLPGIALSSEKNQLNCVRNNCSANIENIPIISILETLADNTGIIYVLDKNKVTLKISVKFEDLSVEKAIKRILIDLSYSIVYNNKGDVQKIIIVDKNRKLYETIATKNKIVQSMPKISNTISPQKYEGMLINSSQEKSIPDGMIINSRQDKSTPDGMVINSSQEKSTPDGMVINPLQEKSTPEGMVINPPQEKSTPDGMVINLSQEKSTPNEMVINTSKDKSIPDGMGAHQIPDKAVPEGMTIN